MSEEFAKVMLLLGEMKGKLESMEKHQNRDFFALLGIIAAQIGVKVLGSDPLLDAATALALLGCALIIGALTVGLRMMKTGDRVITTTGKWFTVVIFFILIMQFLVYFGDLGMLPPRFIYVVRIVQNISILVFAWNLMREFRLFIKLK